MISLLAAILLHAHIDCNGVVMHRDYGHHIVIEPKCRTT